MDGLPASLADRLQALAYEERAVAFLHIDADLRLLGAGGNLDNYGLGSVRCGEPALEQAYFLDGLLPLSHSPFFVPAVELVAGRAADVHLYRESDATWVLLLDVTAERNAAQRMQQKAYDMTLLEEREAQLNRRLEATNAALLETQRDLEIARDAIHEELRRKQLELTEARTLQLSLLPPPHRVAMNDCRLSIETILEPAKEVGGDLADYFCIDDDLLVLVLGDVSGKGAGAALMMARTHASFRGLSARPDAAGLFRSPEKAVELVNAALAATNASCTFVTLLLAAFDRKTRRLTYVRAGHVPPFLRRGNGTVEKLAAAGGLPLGLMEDAAYKSAAAELGPGDGLLIITDGITEATDLKMELFGDGRVTEFLSTSTAQGEALLHDLFARVRVFEAGSPPADDKAAILLELQMSHETCASASINV